MGKTGKVIAVCISEKKGTQKTEVPSITLIPDWGIEGDAHAGKWHRQVSLLSLERIEEFRRTREFRMDLGVGIQNSIDRLNILYGDEASLEISRIEPQGTRIDIMIPIKRREAGEDERDFG